MRRAVLNVVGLTTRDLAGGKMPRLAARAAAGSVARVKPAFPAVTCTAQATYLTGRSVTDHGVVANGWFDRSLSEVHFWKQSNRLVGGEKLWETLRARRPGLRIANLFWWFNLGSSVDLAVTPRPIYKADGSKVLDIATWPHDLRFALKKDLWDFPFGAFWGPYAGLDSSQWIADAARWVEAHERPDLNLVYLPHLDYDLQRHGPDSPEADAARAEIDKLVGRLADDLERSGVEVTILSEYGITAVERAVCPNRLFRAKGWLAIKDELGGEILDTFHSRVFAACDHQVAHVYVRDTSLLGEVRALLEATPGVGRVLDAAAQKAEGLWHPRSGELVAVADARSWFAYTYWEDDARAPDFARTVDIHRKPGYDPCELLIDRAARLPMLRVLWFLLRKKLGFRALLKLTPLDPQLIRGSHGRVPEDSLDWPVLIEPRKGLPVTLAATDVRERLAAGF
ncbi:MAG: alkaline phosphatase family protein [Opitutales bacterium]